MLRAMVFTMAAIMVGGSAAAAEPDGDPIARGGAIYREHCASCHGAEAQGAPNWEEPNAAGELPPPPHGPEGHTWRHSDDELRHMIAKGWRDPFNRTQRLTMPAFGAILSDAEIAAVIAYLKTLWTDEQRAFQARRNAEKNAGETPR